MAITISIFNSNDSKQIQKDVLIFDIVIVIEIVTLYL